MNWIRLILFSILIPGTVAFIIPNCFVSYKHIALGGISYLGYIIVLIGVLFYLATIFKFMIDGKGTPAIWFTKRIKFLIGEEPVHLVSNGLYQYIRNPM